MLLDDLQFLKKDLSENYNNIDFLIRKNDKNLLSAVLVCEYFYKKHGKNLLRKTNFNVIECEIPGYGEKQKYGSEHHVVLYDKDIDLSNELKNIRSNDSKYVIFDLENFNLDALEELNNKAKIGVTERSALNYSRAMYPKEDLYDVENKFVLNNERTVWTCESRIVKKEFPVDELKRLKNDAAKKLLISLKNILPFYLSYDDEKQKFKVENAFLNLAKSITQFFDYKELFLVAGNLVKEFSDLSSDQFKILTGLVDLRNKNFDFRVVTQEETGIIEFLVSDDRELSERFELELLRAAKINFESWEVFDRAAVRK